MKIALITQPGCTACDSVKNVVNSLPQDVAQVEIIETLVMNTPISELMGTSCDKFVTAVPSLVVVSDDDIVYSLESTNPEMQELLESPDFWSQTISKYF